MSSISTLITPALRRALGGALALICLVGFTGCGETDPLVALRDMGADFKRTRARTVEYARMPKGTVDEDLEYLPKLNQPETIKLLDLSGTEITNDGLKHLQKLTGLETLNLNDTNIGDEEEKEEDADEDTEDADSEEAEGLAALKELRNLKTLRIAGTKITKAELDELLTSLPQLETLDIVKQPPVDPETKGEGKGRTWLSALNFGIDLAGGTNLVYQVDRDKIQEKIGELEREGKATGDNLEARVTGEVMDQMVAAVSRRLNPSGVEEITVRKVGSDRIEVIIPKASPEVVERKKRQMTRLGSLEFALLANRRDHGQQGGVYERINASGEMDLYREDGTLEASWREVGRDANGNYKKVLQGGEVIVEPKESPDPDVGVVDHFLVYFGRPDDRVTGEYLSRAYETTDENGRLAVGFLFNTQGGFRFQRLTSANKPLNDGFERRLAILLDNKIHSAPSIITTISDQGQITGQFTHEEIQELIGVLNAGALSVPIKETPISELTVSPLLGHEVQQSGFRAIMIAATAVLCFMLIYYLFAGAVADVCLVLNIILVMGTMALIDATFTLPGLAGIVLTIGMAVDANVLIFERIREELHRGSSMRLAIQNGFGRALSAIVDANLTTLITAVVLYTIGTDQIRGFAVTLFIGIVMSMFTALFFGRLVFEICERKRWITSLKMLSIVKPHTTWRFISRWRIAAVFSAVVIVGGISTFYVRGSDNFDIDFSGGTMLTFELTEDQEIEQVKDALTKHFDGEAITLERLSVSQEEDASGATHGSLFRVRTKLTDENDEESEEPIITVEERVIKAMDEAKFHLKQLDMTPKPDEIAGSILPILGEQAPYVKFNGGHRLNVTFDEAQSASDIRRYFTSAIGGIEDDGQAKYPNFEDQFRVKLGEAASPGSSDAKTATYKQAELWVTNDVEQADFAAAVKTMQEPQFEGKNSFASAVAGEMKQSAVMAILVSLIAIVAYIWFRFQRITFGLAAVVAVVHDVLAVLGIVAMVSFVSAGMGENFLQLEDFKINLPMIAAFLTIVGYSLNDTIVVFDRIREVRGKNPALTEEMIDTSLNQTLSRTLLTSLTTWFVVGILYFIGGAGIHGFAFCLVMGVIVGTYSSIYVASPVLLWLMNRETQGRSQSTQNQPAKAAAG